MRVESNVDLDKLIVKVSDRYVYFSFKPTRAEERRINGSGGAGGVIKSREYLFFVVKI